MRPALQTLLGAGGAALLCVAMPAAAQTAPVVGPALTYADLAYLAESAPLVLHAQVTDQATVKPERAPGLRPGHARLYVEARTLALLSGNAPVGEALRYLVDVPLTAKGKVPKIERAQFIVFARPGGRPGEIQLVDPGAQVAHSPALEARLRPVLAELVAADRPPVVTGIRDALSVPGNLAGESETQLFLETARGDPVSLTVTRRPGQSPRWGVSWSEIVDQAARPPVRDTLAWYRLACALPLRLPDEANLTRDSASRLQAAQDYAFVLEQLGPCERSR